MDVHSFQRANNRIWIIYLNIEGVPARLEIVADVTDVKDIVTKPADAASISAFGMPSQMAEQKHCVFEDPTWHHLSPTPQSLRCHQFRILPLNSGAASKFPLPAIVNWTESPLQFTD